MAVLMSLAGNSAGDGFLVAPAAGTYPAELSLRTDSGTMSVTLQASPNPAGLVFSQTSVNLSTTPTAVMVHATLQSASRGDTTIQVLDGGSVVASFAVTSIAHPVVRFRGRFEARFATQPAFYNQDAMYTATSEAVGPGWTWGLEGEPSFVPAVGNVPENLETPVGRVIRLNNPVALRSHAAPITSTVDSIAGETTSGVEVFTTGDALIGQPVDLGPDTYFAGNRNIDPADPTPEEYFADAYEPMGLFELHLGTMFSGKPHVGPFTHKATALNEHTRTPDTRPIATGLVSSAAERTEFGLPALQAFSEARIDLLVADYNALPAGDTPQRRNLARRIGHLLSSVSLAKRQAVQNANPGAFTVRPGTLAAGWNNKEVFNGRLHWDFVFQPAGSSVVDYMSDFTVFAFQWHPFAFHSDELCGHHKGTVNVDVAFGGSYTGDPHTRTVDGTNYDFQAVGEFTLLRYGEAMEIQVRQSPVPAVNPVADSHSGLTVCVSIVSAVAARVGGHRIAFQPTGEGKELQFFLDGEPAELPARGIDLGGNRVSGFAAGGETALRVDYYDGTVLTATPAFWQHGNVWYLNVGVSHTKATEGVMGFIPKGSWLPRLRDGSDLGPMPADPGDRYDALYRVFADSWRVTDRTSLFVYERGTSTKTFTDEEWPGQGPPCDLKPGFGDLSVEPLHGMPIKEARMISRVVTEKDLRNNCVFDVATTGDEIWAEGYVLAQELRLYGTAVEIEAHDPPTRPDRLPGKTLYGEKRPPGQSLVVIARVSSLTPGRPTPTGGVTFYVDGVPMNRAVALDELGRARATIGRLKPGKHTIRAAYSGGGKDDYYSSSSRHLLHTVGRQRPEPPIRDLDRPDGDKTVIDEGRDR